MTGISDGFGDGPQSIEEHLAQHPGQFESIASGVVGPRDPRRDDLAQEGLIAAWMAYGEAPSPGLAVYRAQRRIKNLVNPARREHPLGADPSPGTVAVKTVAILDQPTGDPGSGGSMADLLFGGVDALAGVEIAYHHGEIVQAVSALSAEHREYVHKRFWEGWTDSEIARHQGVSTSGIYNRWTRTIRPALVERLAHLVSA